MEELLNCKTIASRNTKLSAYLKKHEIGSLENSDIQSFKILFDNFYTPDANEIKVDIKAIEEVQIDISQYKNKYFKILVNEEWLPTSIKRLAGSKTTELMTIKRAMRDSIANQIFAWKENNPLNRKELCPISNKKLRRSAEVDHIIPFHIISDKFIDENKKSITITYSNKDCNYILDDLTYSKWQEYHFKHAKLRWLSKESNKTAHLH